MDDLPVEGACAAKLAWSWKTAGLSEGKHVVDVVATNTRGEDSRRRFEVFAGNIFLTEVGARFDETRQITEITARNIAPTAEAAGKVELTVWSVEGANNTRKDRVFAKEQKGAPGAATWTWDGRGNDGKARPRGRYVAELVMRDARGKTIQKAEHAVLPRQRAGAEEEVRGDRGQPRVAWRRRHRREHDRRAGRQGRSGGADGAFDRARELPLQERRGGQLPRARDEGRLGRRRRPRSTPRPPRSAAKANMEF